MILGLLYIKKNCNVFRSQKNIYFDKKLSLAVYIRREFPYCDVIMM